MKFHRKKYRSQCFKWCLSIGLATVAADALNLVFASDILEFRSTDAENNNLTDPSAGTPDTALIRIAPSDYGDGLDLPRGVPIEDEGDGDIETDEQTLPSARLISNLVHDQGSVDQPSPRNLSQLVFQFGQFLSHDTGLSEPEEGVSTGGSTGLVGNESFPVHIAGDDPDFSFAEIDLSRTIALSPSQTSSGAREQINLITTFIDGSNIYGSDSSRAQSLRQFHSGRLKAQTGPDGHLLPANTFGLSNGNPLHLPESTLFAAGDIRANEQVGLTAIHTLFLREHNRLASIIASTEFPNADYSRPAIDEAIYQRARATVVAQLQKITYYEWLPALIGPDAISDYDGYNQNVDPRITNEFSTAAFRVGHTMLPKQFDVTDRNGKKEPLSLQTAFFNPSFISQNGISGVLRGQAMHVQQQLDNLVVDDVRNFLFGPGFGGLDLGSLNIQRGRDHGIPSYNTVRSNLGLSPASSYIDLTGGQNQVSTALRSAYGVGRVGDVDLWTGGLCETPVSGTSLGPTFTAIFVDQFSRLRAGDRFYFENPSIYSTTFINNIQNTTFADIIKRNTDIDDVHINPNAFFIPETKDYQPDLRFGTIRNHLTHVGDNQYNRNSVGQRITVQGSRRNWLDSYASMENDGAIRSEMRINAGVPARSRFETRFFDITGGRRQNVTTDLLLGQYRWNLSPGTLALIQSRIRVVRPQSINRANTKIRLRAQSREMPSEVDVALSQIQFR